MGTSVAHLDQQVEEDLRRRRELERRRLGEVMVVVGKLEEAVATEAEHRRQSEEALHEHVDRLLEQMVSHVEGCISERFSRLVSSVEALHERCAAVEQGVRQLKGEVPSKLTVEGARLQLGVRELASSFHADCRQRLEADSQLQRAIEEWEERAEQRVQQELSVLERQIEALQQLLDGLADDDGGGPHQALIQEHLAGLNEGLEEEGRKRERADDEVVQAINAYATSLHHGISAANA